MLNLIATDAVERMGTKRTGETTPSPSPWGSLREPR